MSGGDSTGGWGGAIAQEDDCDDIRIHVRLSSVDELVLILVNVNDHLEIQKNDASIVAIKNGQIVGAIASADVIKLKKCIDSGHQYIGIVIEKDDGKCVISISAIK